MTIKLLKRGVFYTSMVILVIGLCFAGSIWAMDEMPGKGITVKPARATWTTGFFMEAIYSRALEHLGYEVEDPKKLANPIFYQSVYNGDVDSLCPVAEEL